MNILNIYHTAFNIFPDQMQCIEYPAMRNNCEIAMTQQQGNHVSQECISDRGMFQSDSKLAKHFVKIECEQRGQRRILFGIILSENVVLTSNEYKVGEYSICLVKYENVSGAMRPKRIKDWRTIVEVWRMQGYKTDRDILSRTFVPIKFLLLKKKMILNSAVAAPMPLPVRPYEKRSTCVVIGGNKINNKTIIVERKADVINRKECELLHPGLAENIICIRVPAKFCNFEHCDEFLEGSALMCDGVLTALVGSNQHCFPLLPRICAGIYEANNWIKSLEQVINPDKEHRKAIVTIGISAVRKSIYGFGVIISKNKILTAYVPNLLNTKIFEQDSFSDFHEARGYVGYGAGKIIYWNKAKSQTNSSSFTASQLQLSVIILNKEIILGPTAAHSMRLPKKPPQKNAKCIVVTLRPRWMKFQITLIDNIECRKELPELHEVYMCIREKLPGTENCLEAGNPIICDGELTAIVAKLMHCERNAPRPVTPIHRFHSWILASMRELELSGSDQSTFTWLLLLYIINSLILIKYLIPN
uniref:Peptidase S1 domain-containing protein n=1 Tax=Glossina brevipalpis TaxID=37001 RepID=A0A1A9WGX6_9MUSC